MPSKPKTKKVVAPLGDTVPAEPIDKNPYTSEMEGTPVLDGPDDKLDADAVMRKEYGDLLRTPDATMILMAILKELVMARVHA